MNTFYGLHAFVNQVVSNFVSNAAKFTPVGGQVKMTAMLCQSDDSLQPPSVQSWIRIRIAVKDSGIGISEADQVYTHVTTIYMTRASSFRRPIRYALRSLLSI